MDMSSSMKRGVSSKDGQQPNAITYWYVFFAGNAHGIRQKKKLASCSCARSLLRFSSSVSSLDPLVALAASSEAIFFPQWGVGKNKREKRIDRLIDYSVDWLVDW